MRTQSNIRPIQKCDVVLVEAGFAGMYALLYLRNLGYPSSVEKCERVASAGYRGFELTSL